MTATLLMIAFALLALAVIFRAAHGQAAAVGTPAELLAALQPLDLLAFRNLTDAEEERYLRDNLPSADFRLVQRTRLAAIAEYVARTAHNAAVLVRLGEAERRSAVPEVARAGQDLANNAVQLRITCLLALAWLRLRMLAPGQELRLSSFMDRYMRVREETLRLSRLRMPIAVSRLEAVL